MHTNDIIKEISFLYELSLSVGQSLDKKENCKNFLLTLMSRKNIEFGGVWIRNSSIPYSDLKTGFKIIYAHPHIKLNKEFISESKFLDECFNATNSFSIQITDGICRELGFKPREEEGAVTFFKLEELGFIALYSSSSNRIWSEIDQTKLRNVIEKFTISLKASLIHEKSTLDLVTIRETQKQLEKAKKEAEESEKLKAAFLSNISHEIRTPINSIVGFSNLLSDKDIDYNQHLDFIQHINLNSRKLLKLINNLIDISKIDSNQLLVKNEIFTINSVIVEIFQKYQNALIQNSELNIKLVFPLNSDDFFINADKGKFLQILDNLVDNAVKFTSNGLIEIGYFLDKDSEPVFYIKDTGVGIPENKKNVIFEKFMQVENSSTRKHEGSGIGLTLCKRLVELMNGKIWFDSIDGIGSNFYFRLNGSGKSNLRLLNESKQNIELSRPIKSFEYSKRNILIAEDVKSNFDYLNAIIELTDANVIWAKNGKDAIEIFSTYRPQIDLVLLDIRMPEIGGMEALKQIKQINKSVPVVVQTAFVMDNEKEKIFQAGADEFISKPIDPYILMKILNKYLGFP